MVILSLLGAAFVNAGHAATPQTLSFPPIADHWSRDVPFALSATASSGLPVTLEIVSGGSIATLSGGSIILTGAVGAVTLRASQGGDATYAPAADVYHTFCVGEASQRFIKIFSGPAANHSIGIRADGTLWEWGYSGQPFDFGTTYHAVPMQVGTAAGWTTAATGSNHTLALRADGTLWAWGNNDKGQLGDGTTTAHDAPAQIPTGAPATTWTAIAAGIEFSLALRSDGTLWAWGYNVYGMLGDGSRTARTTPVQIGTGTTWTALTAGSFHAAALRADGSLWVWGSNNTGQLGVGTTTDCDTPTQVGVATDWTSVACGGIHTVACRADGTLWAWGNNESGQLGDDITTSFRTTPMQVGSATDWISAACGSSHAVALRADGTLWAWGANQMGQVLGSGTSLTQTSPVQIGSTATPSAAPWTSMAIGAYHSLALRADGSLWGWGNAYVLGSATLTDPTRPRCLDTQSWTTVASGGGASSFSRSFSAAIRSDGTLWAWGNNGSGQLGDGTTINRLAPVQIGTASDWVRVVCGRAYTAALRSNGSLWLWGSAIRTSPAFYNFPSSYLSSLVPIQVDTAGPWADLAAGSDHLLALRSDGTLWAWGDNDYNQGAYSPLWPTPPALTQIGTANTWIALAAGARHSAALRSDGTLWTWGHNFTGPADYWYANMGPQVYIPNPGAMTFAPTQVGTGTDWTALASGENGLVALRGSGTLWTWGYHRQGGAYESPYFSPLGGLLWDGGLLYFNSAPTWSASTVDIDPVQLGSRSGWTSIASGSAHLLARHQDGTLWSCGSNSYGQLGTGTAAASLESLVQVGSSSQWSGAIACSGSCSVALRLDGSLWVWGDDLSNDIGNAPFGTLHRIWSVPAPQGLAFTIPATLLPGQPLTLAATATSGLPVSYAAIGPAMLEGNLLTPTGSGPITLIARQFGDDSWLPAESVLRALQVQVDPPNPQQIWRHTHFGTAADFGAAADTADPDYDGLPNLLEFAFGMDPVSSASNQLPQPVHNIAAQTFTYTFTEPAGVVGTGLIYTAKASTGLDAGGWTMVPDTGSGTMHIFTVSTSGLARMFIQLQVTAP